MSSEFSKDKNGPGVVISPVVIFFLVLGSSFAIHNVYPRSITGGSVALKYTGFILMALAGVFALDAGFRFRREKTPVPPWKPATKLVTSGVYRFTRNPLYVALCLLQLGIGFIIDSVSIMVGVLGCALIIYELAIKKEEAYLERKFGEEYLGYKRTTRRWL